MKANEVGHVNSGGKELKEDVNHRTDPQAEAGVPTVAVKPLLSK